MPINSIIGGMIGQSGSQTGGDMAWNAATLGNSQNQAEATRARNALAPYTAAGTGALGKITRILGLGDLTDEGHNPGGYYLRPNGAAQEEERNAFKASPGYKFRVDEGIKARDRGAASRGMVLSGAQSKAIDTFGQESASEEWNNYLSQLMGLAGGGQSAATSGNATAAGLTGAGSNMLFQGGTARGSAYSQGANALASGIGSATQNLIGGAYLGRKGGFF